MTAIAAMTEVDDLALARLLADAADRISLDLYRDAELLVVTKPDRTEVSEADRAVEAALRRLLRTHRPEQGVRWLLDPVDATSNFVRGVDWWGHPARPGDRRRHRGGYDLRPGDGAPLVGDPRPGRLDHRPPGPLPPATGRLAGR